MKIAFALLLVLHGLLHLVGFAKAFGLAEFSRPSQPISRPAGVQWLAAAVLMIVSAGAFLFWPSWAWALGATALIVSQVLIVTAWSDAKVGTLANAVLLVGVLFGFLSYGPWSFRTEYQREVGRGLSRAASPAIVTEADLDHLPLAVRRYLRITNAVGQPQIYNFRARFRGQIRSSADAPFVSFTAEQHDFFLPASRLVFLSAERFGVPIEALHIYEGKTATMRVKLAALVPRVDAQGAEMNQSETVTLFNDMCLLAPATLIDPSIRWQEIDARTVGATFSNAGTTIHAQLFFNAAGELADFRSDDRYRSSSDGKSFTRLRFSTPVRDYRTIGARKLIAYCEARWHAKDGEFTYGRFELTDIEYNLNQAGSPSQK